MKNVSDLYLAILPQPELCNLNPYELCHPRIIYL